MKTLKTITKIIMSIIATPLILVGAILIALSSLLFAVGGVEEVEDEH